MPQLNPPSGPIFLFTLFILRIPDATSATATRAKGRVAAAAEAGQVEGVEAVGPAVAVAGRAEVAEEAVAAEGSVLPKSRTAMARKFWSASPKKPAAVFLRCRRKNRSVKSTPASSRNCELSTTWALPATKRATQESTTIFSCR